jgi:hypothetical protein
LSADVLNIVLSRVDKKIPSLSRSWSGEGIMQGECSTVLVQVD